MLRCCARSLVILQTSYLLDIWVDFIRLFVLSVVEALQYVLTMDKIAFAASFTLCLWTFLRLPFSSELPMVFSARSKRESAHTILATHKSAIISLYSVYLCLSPMYVCVASMFPQIIFCNEKLVVKQKKKTMDDLKNRTIAMSSLRQTKRDAGKFMI